MKKKKKLIKKLRRSLRYVVKLLPKSLRYNIYKRQLSLADPPPELEIKIAQTPSELEEAFKILHDSYVDQGYMKVHDSGMRVTPYHALPSTVTILAKWNDQIVGTLSIIRDSPLKLPLEQSFDVTSLKKKKKVAEISSLAIKKEFRGSFGEIFFPLTKYMVFFAKNFFGIDQVVIAVNPRQEDLYTSLFLFERLLGKQMVEEHNFANGAPAVGMTLDLVELEDKMMLAYQNSKKMSNMYHFVFKENVENLVLDHPGYNFPVRDSFSISYPVMKPEMLDFYFNRVTDIFKNLSRQDLIHMANIFQFTEHNNLLPDKCRSFQSQRRHEVRCPARIILKSGRIIMGVVVDLSESGINFQTKELVLIKEVFIIDIRISEFRVSHLKGSLQWKDVHDNLGISLTQVDAAWKEFISELNLEFEQPEFEEKKSA